jgi:regulator of RNase E activity RraA
VDTKRRTMDPSDVPIDELRAFSTPTVLNGLKRLGVHPSELETIDRTFAGCVSPDLGPRVGFAATRRVFTNRTSPTQSAGDPMLASRQADEHLLTVPAPRFVVAENVGDWVGPVCIWGEVAANLYMALGCTAGITNGPVRDVDEIEAAGFQTFAGGTDVGGGFVETLEFGRPVQIGGVTIASGDLLHGDRHGVVKVPLELAGDLPKAIGDVQALESRVIEVTRSPDFTLDRYVAAWTS